MYLPILSRPSDYHEYRERVLVERAPVAVRTAAKIILALNSAFLLLDRYAFPELFWNFLGARMALNASLACAYFWTYRISPTLGQLQLVLSAGALLLWVVYQSGAPTTEYYAGLMLLFLGVPLVLPLTVLETLGTYALILGTFLASPWFEAGFSSWGVFTIHSLFLGGAAFTGIASSHFLETVRLNEYRQRREIEAARDSLEEMDRAKSRFTANIHHELRTPLTLTLAPLEGMIAGDFGPTSPIQRDYLKTMHVNALRLLKLINNLLDLAKIESEQLRIVRRPIDIAEIVSDVVAGARPMAERKRIDLSVAIEPERCVINADRDAVEKVVLNLLGNALKFTGSPGSIEVYGTFDQRGFQLSVKDSGVGLEEKDLSRVFDRFAQADGSATRKHEGTGIGLSLSKELVDLHGGSIWAESEGVGAGATFQVLFPHGAEDGTAEEVLSSGPDRVARDFEALSAEVEAGAGDGLRLAELEHNVDRWVKAQTGSACQERAPVDAPEVVICEDNADMRKLLAHILSAEFRVTVASNGREGLEAVRRDPPDLVLTDVMMPEMSGTELCREIKRDPSMRSIPVVIVTSKAEREMKIEGLELGADDYVTKPFHSRELLARVRSLVGLRRLQAELANRNKALEQTNRELSRAMDDLKEAEAQLVLSERLAAVGELAAGIAHEANNPVNFAVNAARTLHGYLSDIQEAAEAIGELEAAEPGRLGELQARLRRVGFSEMPGEVAELVGIVEEGLARTGRLVGDLRDFAAGRVGRRCHADLVRVLESTRQLLGHSFSQQGVSVIVSAPSALPQVFVDPQAIGQVFLNILKNAGEALEKSGGQVQVRFTEAERGVRVEFQDDGPGIEPADLERLFDPFYSTKGPGRGSGLGLSISRKVIEEHGGSISADSAAGEGASFVIWLPLESLDES